MKRIILMLCLLILPPNTKSLTIKPTKQQYELCGWSAMTHTPNLLLEDEDAEEESACVDEWSEDIFTFGFDQIPEIS
jgi:hypothetical protein